MSNSTKNDGSPCDEAVDNIKGILKGALSGILNAGVKALEETCHQAIDDFNVDTPSEPKKKASTKKTTVKRQGGTVRRSSEVGR